MKVRIVSRVTIAAEPRAVFKYLKDLSYHFLWNPGLDTIEPVTKLAAGKSYQTGRTMLGKRLTAENLVTKFEENRELELENTTGLIHYRVNYSLYEAGDNTKIVCRTDIFSTSRAFAFAKPVLEALGRRELQSDLQALKVAVEQQLE